MLPGMLSELRHLLRPIQMRIANSIARAVVHLVDDAAKMQLLQIGVLAGEDPDDAERVQQYGLTGVPLAGAEAVVLFPNGDRGHPLVVAVDDRRYRPTGLQPGEVAIYSTTGARITLLANGTIRVQSAPGGRVDIQDDAGALTALDELVHGTGIDPFTGSTYKVLGNTSAFVRAKK